MEPEKLLSELSWLKRLASVLVRDQNDADDVVQETWLVAAEHAPTDGRPLKPWLSRVALNVVRMRSRASTRRSAREVAIESFAETLPTADEMMSRVEAQRTIADAVLKLAEPYRNTILLHYFEELSSAEIARRFGIPEGTVRRRLKVGLDELRARLHAKERETGRPVLAVLAPIAVKRSAASAALGVVIVKKVVALVVLAVGLLFVGSQLYKHHARASDSVVTEDKHPSGTAPSGATPVDVHVVVAVVDSIGPVANALVRCAPTNGDVVVVKTASDGNASVDLEPDQWSIAASADGHEPAATTLAVVTGRADRVKLVLAFGGQTLTGTVTDMTGGVIAGARVDAARLHLNAKAGSEIAVAFSDNAGRYKLAVGTGEVFVAATHPEYVSQTRYVDLGVGGATTNFALVPGGAIEGVVRDVQTNRPVAGAAVWANSDSPMVEIEAAERIVTSDAAGKFRVAGLRPGGYELSGRDGARRSRVPVGVEVGVAEQQTNIVVLIGGTATIRGNVVDEGGAPASKVAVSVFGEGDRDKAISDDKGAFVLEGLPPKRYSLAGTNDSYVSDGQAIVELKKTDVAGVVVHVRRGLEVSGHLDPREVCDVEIANAEPGAERRFSTTTTPDGAFHFAPFGSGNATLVARCPNGDQGTLAVAVATGTAERIVPLTPGGSIAGRIIDTTGKPVAGVMVSAEPNGEMRRIDGGNVVSGFVAVTTMTGTFEITGLRTASYRLSVLDTGRPMKATKSVRLALAAAQHATGVEISVERPADTIQGTVTGPDGAPIAEAWVAVHLSPQDQLDALSACDDPSDCLASGSASLSSHQPPPAMTDARGHFELAGLPHGKYQVVAEAQAGVLRGGAADVTTNAEIAIRLASVGSLHGTVYGPHGPTDLFLVRLDGGWGGERWFTDGAFVFPRLDSGDYTIDVESTDGTGKATVHVSSDKGASVDILLVAKGTVTGRVVDKAGRPVSGLGVALVQDQPAGDLHIELHGPPPSSGPDGRFQVQGPPGTRTLVILGRKLTAKRGLAVAADNTVDVGDVIVDEQPK